MAQKGWCSEGRVMVEQLFFDDGRAQLMAVMVV